MLHGKHRQKSKRKQSVSRCACGQKARPKQRNCYECHASAQVEYRARRRDAAKVLRVRLNKFAKMAANLAAIA